MSVCKDSFCCRWYSWEEEAVVIAREDGSAETQIFYVRIDTTAGNEAE